jgi:hypothetical protein
MRDGGIGGRQTIIPIPIHKRDLNPRIQKIRQILLPPGSRIIANTPKRRTNRTIRLRPIQRHTQPLLHMGLVQPALVPRVGERRRARRRNVVVVDVAVEIRVSNCFCAECFCGLAEPVYGCVEALVCGVVEETCVSAYFNLGEAAVWAVEVVDYVVISRLIIRLDAIRIIKCHLRVRRPLHISIHAAVDDEQGVEVQDVGLVLRVPVLGVVAYAVVLLLEIGGEAGAVAAAVGFGRDGYAVVVGFVGWKFLEPDLREVPEGAGGVCGSLGCEVAVLGTVCS